MDLSLPCPIFIKPGLVIGLTKDREGTEGRESCARNEPFAQTGWFQRYVLMTAFVSGDGCDGNDGCLQVRKVKIKIKMRGKIYLKYEARIRERKEKKKERKEKKGKVK